MTRRHRDVLCQRVRTDDNLPPTDGGVFIPTRMKGHHRVRSPSRNYYIVCLRVTYG